MLSGEMHGPRERHGRNSTPFRLCCPNCQDKRNIWAARAYLGGTGKIAWLGCSMWHCPKCGEGIEDAFDACWKCGTEKAGIVPAEPEEEHGDLGDCDARQGRIVELCSAANAAEAYALQGFLQEAGIRSARGWRVSGKCGRRVAIR